MTFTQVSSPVLEISITSPGAGNYVNSLNHEKFNVSGNCPVNGETISVTAADGGHSVNAKTACASGNYSTSLDLTALLDGSVTITADRLDAAGNTLTRASVGVTKDTVPPEAPLSVTLSSPGTTSPSQSATPTIRVGGVLNDLAVSIHADDSTCSLPSLKGSGSPANNQSVEITSAPLDEGIYVFYANATDRAGNSSCSYASATYKRDLTHPTVTISSAIGADPTAIKVMPVTVTFSEPVSGFTQSALTVSGISGGAILNFSGSGAGYSFDLTLPADSTGTFTIDIAAGKVKDLALNENTAAATYSKTFYTKTPTISGTTPTRDTTPDLTVGDIIPGLTANIYDNPACTTSAGSALSTGTSQVVTSSTISGNTTFYARVIDTDGNKSTCSTTPLYVVLDVTQPTVVISSATAANPTTQASIPITVTFSESVSGFTSDDLVYSGGTISGFSGSGASYAFNFIPNSGTGTLTIGVASNSATDAVGNPNLAATQYSKIYYNGVPTLTGASLTRDTTPDLTVGNIIAGLTANIYSDSSCSALKGYASSAGAAQTVSPSSPLSASGTYGYHAAVTDSQNVRSGCSPVFTVTLDIDSPTVTVNQAASQVNDPTNALPIRFQAIFSEPIDPTTFTATDIVQGGTATGITWSITDVNNLHQTFDLVANITGPGTIIPGIAASSVQDPAGNDNAASTSTDNTVLFDNTPPTITITSPPSSSYVNSANQAAFAIGGACTDSLSGVAGKTVTITATGAGSQTYTTTCDGAAFNAAIDLSSLGNGALTITASITDAATNSATPSSVSLTKDSLPPLAPALSVNPAGPADNNSPAITGMAETNSTVNAYANASCGDPVIASGTAAQFTSPGITLSVADNSSNSFSVKAVDQAGNVSPCSASVSYVEDSAPPASSFVINNGTADNALDTTSAYITLKFTATDNSAPITMCISDNTCGSCNLSANAYEPFAASKPVLLIGNGLKTFYAKFKDGLSHETPCLKRTIYYAPSGQSAVQARFQPAPDWNDYVKPDGATACDASTDTFCIHGGEQRTVTVPETSCTGLSMADTLQAFDWYCDDTSGSAVFTSRLKFDKGLAQLIDTTNNLFLGNSVTYYINNVSKGSSTPAKWWSNIIAQLSGTDSSPTVLSGTTLSPVKIYVLNTGSVAYTGGFNINADKIAVVISPGTTLAWSTGSTLNNVDTSTGKVGSPNAKAVLAAGTQNYIWIEGALSGSSVAGYGVFLHSVKFADIRRLSLSSNLANGVHFESTTASRMTNVTSAGNTLNGVYFNASSFNLLSGIFTANNASSGLSFNYSNNNRLSALSSSSNGLYGIHFNNSASNAGSDLKAANNASRGIQLDSSASNKFTKLRAYNNESTTSNGISAGVLLQGGSNSNSFQDVNLSNNHFDGFVLNASSNNTITRLTSTNQGAGAFGFYFFSGSDNVLHNAVTANNNSTGIAANSATNSTASQIASNNTAADSNTPTYLGSHLTAGLSGAFGGPSNSTLYASITDWFNFGSLSFATWGKAGSAFPDVSAQGRCVTGGNCGTWDWSLKKDTVSPTTFINPIWNKTGDGSNLNAAFNVPVMNVLQNCPSQVDGDQTLAIGAVKFLKSAVETIGDGAGDDDGLCESSENCLYTPNFGAYQGHGGLYECVFNPTATADHLSNIRIFGYDTNGY